MHQLSPTGAMGMNTGIGDVVDLGWKLAAVAQGWGGPNLLASYSAERQPIGVRAINHTSEFHLSHGKFHEGFAAIEDEPKRAAHSGPRSAQCWSRRWTDVSDDWPPARVPL